MVVGLGRVVVVGGLVLVVDFFLGVVDFGDELGLLSSEGSTLPT